MHVPCNLIQLLVLSKFVHVMIIPCLLYWKKKFEKCNLRRSEYNFFTSFMIIHDKFMSFGKNLRSNHEFEYVFYSAIHFFTRFGMFYCFSGPLLLQLNCWNYRFCKGPKSFPCSQNNENFHAWKFMNLQKSAISFFPLDKHHHEIFLWICILFNGEILFLLK